MTLQVHVLTNYLAIFEFSQLATTPPPTSRHVLSKVFYEYLFKRQDVLKLKYVCHDINVARASRGYTVTMYVSEIQVVTGRSAI